MVVGSLRVRLLVRESYTLKDKRQVVRSIKDRLRNSFNVAIAEVDAEDDRQLVVLGLATVANETQAVRSLLDGSTVRTRSSADWRSDTQPASSRQMATSGNSERAMLAALSLFARSCRSILARRSSRRSSR